MTGYTNMRLTGLYVEYSRIADVLQREDAPRVRATSGKVYGEAARQRQRGRRVEELVLEATSTRYRGCSCEDHGLHAGMTIQRLIEIDGCKIQFACPRLDAVRRHYGV